MNQILLRVFSVVVLSVLASLQTSIAAERAERAVTALLQQEGQEAVPQRSAVLQPVLEQSPDLAAARWLAGYVAAGKGWVPFEQIATQSADDATLREYHRRRGTKDLKADEHLELANWCEKQRLRDQARAHLFAIVAEHPQRADLWQRLGYKLVDDRWMTAEEERELEQRWQQRDRDLKHWRPKAANLAKRLADPNPAVQAIARQELMEIKDIAALPALEKALTATPELALEFVRWAKGIWCIETTLALARQAIVSAAEPVRAQFVAALRDRPLDDYAPAVLNMMSTPYESGQTVFVAPSKLPPVVNPWSNPYQAGQVVAIRQFCRETRDSIQLTTVRTIGIARTSPETITRSVAFPSINSVGSDQRVAREQNDQARSLADQAADQEQRLLAANQWIDSVNQRVDYVLANVTGLPQTETVQSWWNWYEGHTATESVGPKGVVEVSEVDALPVSDIRIRQVSCLPAGTPVFTQLGPRPIESLKVGDRVLSKDIDSGELAFRSVLKTTVRSPQPLVKLHSERETLQATRGHHFFVSGRGWVMARDLKPGDRFHGVHGTVTLTDVSAGDTVAVYNLVVERANTYFVGNALILSHDVTPPSPTNVKVPGLAAR